MKKSVPDQFIAVKCKSEANSWTTKTKQGRLRGFSRLRFEIYFVGFSDHHSFSVTLVPPRLSLFYSAGNKIKTLSRDPRVQASLQCKRVQNIKALSSLQGSSRLPKRHRDDECPPLNYHNPMASLPLAVMAPLPLDARAICSLQSGKRHEQDQQQCCGLVPGALDRDLSGAALKILLSTIASCSVFCVPSPLFCLLPSRKQKKKSFSSFRDCVFC
jgi:hypothetical protein